MLAHPHLDFQLTLLSYWLKAQIPWKEASKLLPTPHLSPLE